MKRIQTAEQEKQWHMQGDVGAPTVGPHQSSEAELREVSSNGRYILFMLVVSVVVCCIGCIELSILPSSDCQI